jgi:transposase
MARRDGNRSGYSPAGATTGAASIQSWWPKKPTINFRQLHVIGMRKMRYFAGRFWTPITDAQLQRLEAQGLSAAKIAAKLGVSRNSVIARSQRLRGLSRTFPSYLREQEKARASIAARKRKMNALLSKLRQEIARGIPRNEAIIRARKAGATLQAIGEVLGVTRQRVRQIL